MNYELAKKLKEAGFPGQFKDEDIDLQFKPDFSKVGEISKADELEWINVEEKTYELYRSFRKNHGTILPKTWNEFLKEEL